MVSVSATVILFILELVILRNSTAPSLSSIGSNLGRMLEETNHALILVPILMGLVTVAGLFMVPLLPLPEVIPFV